MNAINKYKKKELSQDFFKDMVENEMELEICNQIVGLKIL